MSLQQVVEQLVEIKPAEQGRALQRHRQGQMNNINYVFHFIFKFSYII